MCVRNVFIVIFTTFFSIQCWLSRQKHFISNPSHFVAFRNAHDFVTLLRFEISHFFAIPCNFTHILFFKTWHFRHISSQIRPISSHFVTCTRFCHTFAISGFERNYTPPHFTIYKCKITVRYIIYFKNVFKIGLGDSCHNFILPQYVFFK